MDEDVYREEMALRKEEITDEIAAIRIIDLFKRYKATRRGGCCDCCKCIACRCCCKCFCGKRIPQFVSVDHVWYYVEQNQLFCLLGSNGAGKTTTINILTGLVPPTHGEAYLCGYSMRTQMPQIRAVMGVCPQFDLLWNELTGFEHLVIFAGLKGIPSAKIVEEARTKLKEVELTEAANKIAGKYSGGMKRRLSVAMALIGNPKVVFLDEPTTGMDPVSRRQVWNIIERAKKGRVIVLTTHSMEEADILSDKIAIMTNGSLSCIGSALHLKNKFGTGYRITVGANASCEQQVIDYFAASLPGFIFLCIKFNLLLLWLGCRLESEPISGFMTFDIPRKLMPSLSSFFEELEEKKEELQILDVQLSMTSLEEVFLRIAKATEKRVKSKHRVSLDENSSTDDTEN
jgi:ABC-type multidrug transport system ATPase subunit